MADSRPEIKRVRVRRELLDEVRAILGTTSDAETVDQALDLVRFRREVSDGIRQMSGANAIRDIYEAEN
jgi:hypothetical protein